MDSFDNPGFRKGWHAGKRFEKKRHPLWLLAGFMLREIALFVVWALTHN